MIDEESQLQRKKEALKRENEIKCKKKNTNHNRAWFHLTVGERKGEGMGWRKGGSGGGI